MTKLHICHFYISNSSYQLHNETIRIPYLSSLQTGYLGFDRLTSMLRTFNLLLLYYTKTCKKSKKVYYNQNGPCMRLLHQGDLRF